MRSALILLIALSAFIGLAHSGNSCEGAGPRRTGPGPVYKVAGVPTKREVCAPSRIVGHTGSKKLLVVSSFSGLSLRCFLTGISYSPRNLIYYDINYNLRLYRPPAAFHRSSHAKTMWYVSAESCKYGGCWGLEEVKVPTTRMLVHGRVFSANNCAPIANANLDIWQTSVHGRYGSPAHLEEPGYCRARVVSDKDGKYEFETDIAGPYGILSIMSPEYSWWPNVPPFLPMHIHVISWAPKFEVFSTQLYFPNDAARLYDPRDNYFGVELGALETRNVFNLTLKDGIYHTEVNFYLTANSSSPHTDLVAAVKDAYCQNPSEPGEYVLPLCDPDKVWLMKFGSTILLLVILLVAFIAYKLLRFILGLLFCRSSKPTTTKKSKKE